MDLPFTTNQFFEVFRAYNESVWPAQIVLVLVGLTAIGLAIPQRWHGDRLIVGLLAFLWAWMAIVYHFLFFSGINPAAWLFGALFLLQAILLVWHGVIKNHIRFHLPRNFLLVLALLLWSYAFAVYPLLGNYFGHHYPAMPTFGLPCPTTIFTLGLLLLLRPPFPRSVFIIPLLWTVIASMAAFQLGVLQDLGLIVAGAAGLFGLLTIPKFAADLPAGRRL